MHDIISESINYTKHDRLWPNMTSEIRVTTVKFHLIKPQMIYRFEKVQERRHLTNSSLQSTNTQEKTVLQFLPLLQCGCQLTFKNKLAVTERRKTRTFKVLNISHFTGTILSSEYIKNKIPNSTKDLNAFTGISKYH